MLNRSFQITMRKKQLVHLNKRKKTKKTAVIISFLFSTFVYLFTFSSSVLFLHISSHLDVHVVSIIYGLYFLVVVWCLKGRVLGEMLFRLSRMSQIDSFILKCCEMTSSVLPHNWIAFRFKLNFINRLPASLSLDSDSQVRLMCILYVIKS